MKISLIITGATEMVGKGVMHKFLINPEVEQVHKFTQYYALFTWA